VTRQVTGQAKRQTRPGTENVAVVCSSQSERSEAKERREVTTTMTVMTTSKMTGRHDGEDTGEGDEEEKRE
jgi:hypothetical protein